MTARRSDYDLGLGQRLRAIREARRFTLAAVEALSGGAWKAVTVGSWERADRVPAPGKLVSLCAFYEADPREVLTGEPVPSEAELAELRSENALLRSQIREAVA
jgi:transcriptional regulator with XRE-family HTH domain